MPNDFDILSRLPPLSWRGIVVPSQASSVGFAHGQVEHQQHGADGAHVEHAGRKSARMRFRIPFRAGIAYGDFADLYPTRFRDFWNACLDGSTGPFIHPEFGELEAKVLTYDLSIVPERRDGYDVDVEWVETTENNISIADNPLSPISEAVGLAVGLDDLAGTIDPPIEYDDGSDNDLLTSLKRLQGALLLAQLAVQDMLAKIGNVIASVNSMLDSLASVTDPKAWGVSDALKQIEANLQATKDRLSPAKSKIEFVVATREIAVRDAAASAGMNLDAFFRLNPKLALAKNIAAGKEYFVEVS